MKLPRLYAILDIDLLIARSVDVASFAAELRDAGVNLVQYRNKQGGARTMLNHAELLRKIFALTDAKLIMNDRADLALLANFDGVHVGQEDLSAEDARGILGEQRWVGVSTHTPQQIIEANQACCDYLACGPIFSTASKNNPDPIVGLEGLRAARAFTQKPLVAIGGITLANCQSVLDTGADCVAVISSLLPGPGSQSTRQIAEEFLALLG